MKVREGSAETGDNGTGAEPAASVRRALVRSSSFLALLAALVAIRAPIIGLDLAIGGAAGVANALLILRNNERLLDGRRSRGVYGVNGVARVFGVGALPAIAGITGPAWALAISYAGFFTPLVWYAVEQRRS